MTHRRTCLTAIATAAFVMVGAGCGGDADAPVTQPTIAGTPTPAVPSSTPTAGATPAKPSAIPNAPLKCPNVIAVSTATDGILNVLENATPLMCVYGRTTGVGSGTIQSEDYFGGRSLKAYRSSMIKGKLKGVTTKVVDRADFAPGAFMVTFTSKTSGSVSNLIVPRPGGKFASVSASRIKKGEFLSDVEMTESLARVFLDQ